MTVRLSSSRRLALRLVAILLVLALAAGFRASPTSADAPVIFDNYVEFVELERYNDCSGEYIDFTGYLHIVFFEIPAGSGNVIYKSQVNPANLIGVGEDSGTIYRGTGMSMGMSTVKADDDSTYTSINNVNFVSQGAGGNETIHMTFHVTVTNGTVVTVVENFVSGCS